MSSVRPPCACSRLIEAVKPWPLAVGSNQKKISDPETTNAHGHFFTTKAGVEPKRHVPDKNERYTYSQGCSCAYGDTCESSSGSPGPRRSVWYARFTTLRLVCDAACARDGVLSARAVRRRAPGVLRDHSHAPLTTSLGRWPSSCRRSRLGSERAWMLVRRDIPRSASLTKL